MGTHNKLCGAKHSPSAFSFCSGGPILAFRPQPRDPESGNFEPSELSPQTDSSNGWRGISIMWLDLSETVPNVEIRPRLTLGHLGLLVPKTSSFWWEIKISGNSWNHHRIIRGSFLGAPRSSWKVFDLSDLSKILRSHINEKRRFNVTSVPLLTSFSQISLCWLHNGHKK